MSADLYAGRVDQDIVENATESPTLYLLQVLVRVTEQYLSEVASQYVHISLNICVGGAAHAGLRVVRDVGNQPPIDTIFLANLRTLGSDSGTLSELVFSSKWYAIAVSDPAHPIWNPTAADAYHRLTQRLDEDYRAVSRQTGLSADEYEEKILESSGLRNRTGLLAHRPRSQSSEALPRTSPTPTYDNNFAGVDLLRASHEQLRTSDVQGQASEHRDARSGDCSAANVLKRAADYVMRLLKSRPSTKTMK